MINRAEATAASAEITIEGKLYQISPLTDIDIGELDNWVRVRVIRLARASLTGEETEAEKKSTMQSAFEYASPLTWLNKGIEEMATLDGVARLLWQVLKKHHPELTVKYIKACIVTDKIDVDDTMDVFDLLNGLTKEAAKKKSPQRAKSKRGKTKARRSVGRKSTGS